MTGYLNITYKLSRVSVNQKNILCNSSYIQVYSTCKALYTIVKGVFPYYKKVQLYLTCILYKYIYFNRSPSNCTFKLMSLFRVIQFLSCAKSLAVNF